MKFRFPWQRKSQKEVEALELMLEELFAPVNARVDYVDDLRNRLLGVEERRIFGIKVKSPQFIFLIIGSIASILLFIATGIRTLITLLGSLGVIRKVRKDAQEEENSTDVESMS